jgi:hypothetical protein
LAAGIFKESRAIGSSGTQEQGGAGMLVERQDLVSIRNVGIKPKRIVRVKDFAARSQVDSHRSFSLCVISELFVHLTERSGKVRIEAHHRTNVSQ